MKERLKFKTFTEFCNNADKILEAFEEYIENGKLNLKEYKAYIYDKHSFSDNKQRDLEAKDKCWLWLMSYKYESMDKNDLYSTLGQLKKGK